MVPRVDVVGIPAEATTEHALDTVLNTGHRRLPVYEGTIDNIVGVVRLRNLLDADGTVADRAYPPLFVAESKRVVDLLQEMQEAATHVAIVVDEHGGTSGMVTIEDIVEELFGVVSEEGIVATPLMRPIGKSRWLVDGRMLTEDLAEAIDTPLPEGDWTTVAGLVMGLAGEVPKPGTELDAGDAWLRVATVTRRRIRRVVVTLRSSE
jgi:CBS domain containing-hemolysin-like protein